uniref:Gag-pol polyprotein n=1 Tax=Steinernema glaseri TaxID=37863 RepID=A0A1I8AR56_9BILA
MMKVVDEEAIPPEPETTVPSPVPSVPHVETGKVVVDEPQEGENEDADVVVIKGKQSSDVFMIEQVDEAPPGGNNAVQPRIPPTKGKFAGLAKVH